MEDYKTRTIIWLTSFLILFTLTLSTGLYGGFSLPNIAFIIVILVVLLVDYLFYTKIPIPYFLLLHSLLLLTGVYLTNFYLSLFNIFFLLIGTESLLHLGWRKTLYLLIAFLLAESFLRILTMHGVLPFYKILPEFETIYPFSYSGTLKGMVVWGGILGLLLWNENKILESLKKSKERAEKARQEMESLSDELVALSSILDTKREKLLRINRRLEILNRATQFFYTTLNAREILSYVARVLIEELKVKKFEAEIISNIEDRANIRYSTEGTTSSLFKDPEVYTAFMQQKEIWKKDSAVIPVKTATKPIGIVKIYYADEFLTQIEQETILSLIYAAGLALNNVLLFEEKEMLSITDPLTGLYNRRVMWEVLNHHIEMWKRENYTFSLILLDVDFFKQINDIYGHLTGDRVLKELAEILKKSVRKEDMVFRYGGEEFLILIPGTTREKSLEITERIRGHIATHTFSSEDGREFNITVSAGITAPQPGKSETATELLKKVDSALLEAKRKSKNLTIIK